MIQTGVGHPDQAAQNLQFLVDTGLLTEPRLLSNIKTYLANRKAGSGVALPVPGGDGNVKSGGLSVSTAEQKDTVQRFYSLLLDCLANATSVLSNIKDNPTTNAADAAALQADVMSLTNAQSLVQAKFSAWLQDSPNGDTSVPTLATVHSLEMLSARLKELRGTDEATMVRAHQLVNELGKIVASF
jgi:hypothetical protein